MSDHFASLFISSGLIFLVVLVAVKVTLFFRMTSYYDYGSMFHYSLVQIETSENARSKRIMRSQNVLSTVIVLFAIGYCAGLYMIW